MSKLTERLRQCPYADEYPAIMEEAADRIEHLERVLVQAREALNRAASFQEGGTLKARGALAAINEALEAPT